MVKINEQDLFEAIEDSNGIISVIAKRLSCEWHTAKKQIDKSEKAIRLLKNEKEKTIDKAEEVIFDALNRKDVKTAKWYLNTIGKNRGYVPKIETEDPATLEMHKSILEVLKDELIGKNEIHKVKSKTKDSD